MSCKTLYIISQAHLDPVWVWPWRDGYSECHNTVQAAIDRLYENPDLIFTCSASSLYEWIEESNPPLFEEIKKFVAEGRIEITGGWIVQSDTIISSGESLMRQAYYAKAYFKSKFGVDVQTGYSPDAFGHNSGLCKILAASGFKYYVMHRPDRREKEMPDIFHWEGSDGSKILTIRTVPHGYTTPLIIGKDAFFELVERAIATGAEHQTFFMGVGDHGGGPTVQQIAWIRELQQKHDIRFSSLTDYFKVIEKLDNIPTLRGELTHHAPGCYSTHSGVKSWVSRCGNQLFKAETLLSMNKQDMDNVEREFYNRSWYDYLFNHFHDILPGTAIESAYVEVRDSLGGATAWADRIKIRELHKLAKQVDTGDLAEGGIFVYNPLPWPRKGTIEIDTFKDPNFSGDEFQSLKAVDGTEYPIQWNRAEVEFGPCNSKWGRLTAVVDLPAMGYQTFSLEKKRVANEMLATSPVLDWYRKVSFEVLYDIDDAWAHNLKDRLGNVTGLAELEKVETLENGPLRVRIRATYRYRNSKVVMEMIKYDGMDHIQTDIKVDWRAPYHTLKMVVDTGIESGIIATEQSYDILERTPNNHEQPMRHWAAAVGNNEVTAIVSDSTFAYDSFGTGKLRFTLLRAVPYSVHTDFSHGDEDFIDIGKQQRRFWLVKRDDTAYRNWLPRLSQELRFGAEYVMDSRHGGDKPRCSGDRVVLRPACLTMGAFYPVENGGEFRFYNNSTTEIECGIEIPAAGFEWSGQAVGNAIMTVPISNN